MSWGVRESGEREVLGVRSEREVLGGCVCVCVCVHACERKRDKRGREF